MMLKVFLLSGVLICTALAAINDKVCLPIVPGPEEKVFPRIPDSFKARFAWNMMHVNTTYYVEEIFSEQLDIGVMYIDNLLGPGLKTKILTLAATGEFIMIEDYNGGYGAKCNVSELKSNDFSFPFKNINGKDYLMSGKDVLLLGANTAYLTYVGADVIDDIDADVWNGCLYIKDTDITFNATYYFTMNSTEEGKTWKTASGLKSVIKRIHVVGNNGANNSPVDMTYEYAYFSDVIPEDDPSDLRLYEPPLGAYCAGRKNSKPLPSLPDQFSFSMEVYDPQQDVLTYTDEYYDALQNLTRMDHEGFESRDLVAFPLKMIHDFQTGLSYTIEKYTGTCTIDVIQGDEYDNEVVPGDKTIVRMRTPNEFFNYDNDDKYPWIYQGTFVIRGVECMVWISERPYPTVDSSEMAYWEWYFTSNEWVLSNGDVLEKLEPFKLVISRPNAGNKRADYNIYKFTQQPPPERVFSIAECFNQHNDSRSYEFVVTADVNKYHLDTNNKLFELYVAASIEAFAGVRSLRVHDIQLEFTEKEVFVRFTILGKPAIKGDVKAPREEISLDEAEAYLKSAIESEKFIIFYLVPDNSVQTDFKVDKKSFARVEYKRENGKSVYYVIDDDGDDGATAAPVQMAAPVGVGGAAALGVIILVIGLLLVTLPYYFLVVRKNKEMDSYGRSQLTMSDMHE